MTATKVIIVVVGDEILKGQVVDTNSHMMTSHLHNIGVRVQRIIVVPDEVSVIAEEVKRAMTSADFIITCGGIGPTHDDVTYEGIGQALGQPLVRCEKMAKAVRKATGCRDAGKMAEVPKNATLLHSANSFWPVVRADKVLILPGIPSYCEMAFSAVQDLLSGSTVQFFTQEVRIKADETTILSALNKTVDKFVDRVTLGSYPYATDAGHWHTRITLESTNIDDLCDARGCLLSGLSASLLDMSLTEADAKRTLSLAKGNTPFAKTVAHAIQVIEEALEKYKPEELTMSFNGGKDCTVLMHLLWAVYKIRNISTLQTLYIRCVDPFPEIVTFIDSSVDLYGLKLDPVNGPIKAALEDLVNRKSTVKAVWMGTRRSDPYSNHLNTFQMCDDGWPRLMRISPILDWTYNDVWTFLRCLAVPYCSLYDLGYTSLGNRGNTLKNPALLDKECKTYKPAYKLDNNDLERNGRT